MIYGLNPGLSIKSGIMPCIVVFAIAWTINMLITAWVSMQNANIVKKYNKGEYEKLKKKIRTVSFWAEILSVPPYRKNDRIL